MNCKNCLSLLTDYQRGEVDAVTDAAIFEHVSTCAACREELAASEALTQSLRSAFATERDLPMSVVAGVRQAVRGQRSEGFIAGLRALMRPSVLAPVAAAVVVVFGIVRYDQLHNSASAQTLSADYFVRQHVAQTMSTQSGDRTYAAYVLTSANGEQANAPTP